MVAASIPLAKASPFQLPDTAIRSPRDLDGQDELFLHPFTRGASLHLDFGRGGFGRATLDRDFVSFMMKRGMDPRLGLKGEKKAPFLLTGVPEENREFTFTLVGIPVCNHQVKVQWASETGPLILGTMPRLNADATIDVDAWPMREDALARLYEHASQNDIFDQLSHAQAMRCWWIKGGEAHPSWDVILNGENGQGYSGTANAEDVFRFEPRFFHMQGIAKTYPQNSNDGTLQEFTLNDLNGTGFLESKYFYTKLDTTSSFNRAKAADHRFIFPERSSEFEETSIFTNATRTLQWYFDLGYDAFGGRPIALIVHAVMASGGSNNAQYTPATVTNDATIYIGDGDGQILQNLATDTDVVSHEFGHHVVYQRITAIEGESLVLHEGLADFFAFARTDDPCLGESVCPAGSAAAGCVKYKDRMCLRLGANDYTLNSMLNGGPHVKSQFISGMLWDLREVDGIPKDVLSRLVLDAVGRLLARSKYEHLVLALMTSDRVLHNGKYCSAILARAKKRGLEGRISNLDCSGALPELKESVATSAVGSSSTGSKSGGGFCGVVGGAAGGTVWLTLLALLTPLGVGLLRTNTETRG